MTNLFPFIAGFLMVAILPYIHIGIFYLKVWVPDKPPVDKDNGEYEHPGDIGYKHIYFNATRQTLGIWIVTLLFILLAYESIKYIITLIHAREIRVSMLILYLINIYPLYYGWWSHFTYNNEEFYKFYNHQLLFSMTELVVAVCVVRLCDKRVDNITRPCLVIISISSIHILSAGLDQFIINVLFLFGRKFQIVRDISLMSPDICHVIIPIWVLRKHQRGTNDVIPRKEVMVSVISTLIITIWFRCTYTG